ncbi:hypothetical protein O9H85_22490 [Paenibacillus filicis]|uniref:Uncharacterized protein n=1 Tax=Paenibacillus gyeongsangnamensis TaxID=3388067 RepID=A0ABT4QEA8_9BACL|nr:hypothetical protein [Paenibacillus filicis]MCZ8515137.1 hypothetical protein [Paenibacillus filicis]
MDMNRVPYVMRQVNEGLDELLVALGKVNSLYESAKQVSPMLTDFAKWMYAAEKSAGKARVHSESAPGGAKRKKKSAKRSGKSVVYRRDF